LAVDREAGGLGDIVDIGSGGVFDYDVSALSRITAVDLFADMIDAKRYPDHVTFVQGSALDVPLPSASVDGVVIVILLHHLVGTDVAQSHANMQKCIEEAARILRPGGKLVLVESCVPHWFYAFEKVVYKTAARFIEALLSHPVTLQYPIEVVEEAMHRVFTKVRTEHIPKGKFVLQFGIKVPSALTPVDPYIIVGEKALDAT